jgi:hypothetical protein
MTRTRITIPTDLLVEARQYARDTNRTFSEFVAEAIGQHMARYPRKHKNGHGEPEKNLEARIVDLERQIALLYTQVQIRGNQ